MSFSIGPYQFANRLVLAPMAGVTDRPFRQLCRNLGAGMTVSEMISSRPDLRQSRKSQLRMDHQGEPGPIIVQIAGNEPAMMADAARYNVDHGAQIIDINMGCPAKKVCRKDAGSALMQDPALVSNILQAVVDAVDVPVTLKTRIGWNSENQNVEEIAAIAEQAGVQALAVHGRTRDQKYSGDAEYSLIRRLKQQVRIPIIANGDISDEKKAQMVMDFTHADAIMIGRAAQARPWIFRQIQYYFNTGSLMDEPDAITRKSWLLQHLQNLYQFYGEDQGVRIARKHINWQIGKDLSNSLYRKSLLSTTLAETQLKLVAELFDRVAQARRYDTALDQTG